MTDPVLSPIIGWRMHYFFFYVRITDLLSDAIRDMFVDPDNTDLMATLGIASTAKDYYAAKGGLNYTKLCVEKITNHYFRDEEETWDDHKTATNIPIAPIRDRIWLDSVTDEDNVEAGADPSAINTAQDLEALMNAFDHLRALGIANMTYEDFLRSYGIAVPGKDEGKPELLASFSDFQYPSNTVDPTTGIPASAVSWVFKNGKREPKFFKEPGFIIGLTVCRPKTYFKLAGSMSDFLSRAWDWLPNYLNESAAVPLPETALKHFAVDTGPMGDHNAGGDGYWVDCRDLFVYGDQFQNVMGWNDNASGNTAQYSDHIVLLPTAGNPGQFKYLPAADIDDFFLDAGGTAVYIKHDGYCSLSIKGKQVDYTRGNMTEVT